LEGAWIEGMKDYEKYFVILFADQIRKEEVSFSVLDML
jgi:hypothetical protein